MNIYFTSDTHFSHGRIIEYCNRPYFSVHEMNKAMTEKWNSIVGWEDLVYHLGDFSFGKKHQAETILKKLNGRIILIKGNHDRSTETMLEIGFAEVHSELIIDTDLGKVLLTHKPAAHFKWCKYNFCGHVHEKWKTHRMSNGQLHVNVGVDQWNFRPVNIMEIADEIRRVQNECNGTVGISEDGTKVA